MNKTVLFVNDEEAFLSNIESLFRKYDDIRFLKATTVEEGLKILLKEKVAVVVSDNYILSAESDTSFMTKVRQISPDTVKIILTAYTDLPHIIESINNGEIYKFLVKPCDNDLLLKTIIEGINRSRLIHAMKKENDYTLLSLAQAIELKDPHTRGHCDRVSRYALKIADFLNFSPEGKDEIKYGSWLHDCGKIGVPESILNFNGILGEEEMEIVKKHPQWGVEVAKKANLSETIIQIILHHHERYDGKGYPMQLEGKNIPLEARIVAVADVFDALKSDRPFRKGFDLEKTINVVSSMRGTFLDPELVNIFISIMKQDLRLG